jgi:hypothetical protein
MGALVAGVAHEVRIPLFGISAALDAFEADLATSRSSASIRFAFRHEVSRLASLLVPPLRERGRDVLLLARIFLERIGAEVGRPGLQLGEDAKDILLRYSWPGNLRELERAALFGEGPELRSTDLVDLSPDPTPPGAEAEISLRNWSAGTSRGSFRPRAATSCRRPGSSAFREARSTRSFEPSPTAGVDIDSLARRRAPAEVVSSPRSTCTAM